MPDAVAGHPALEFCNTMALWDRPDVNEYLTDHTAAVIWAREHEIVTAAEARELRAVTATSGAASLRRLRRLRAALYYAVTADASLDEVHGFVARAVARSAYRGSAGATKLYAPMSDTVLVDRVALHMHHLLETYGLGAVSLCASEACGWVFLDPTHRRRWCSMAICGNRAKAARFRRRSGATSA